MPPAADPAVIRAILQSDRAWTVYALADLAPEYRDYARWHIAAGGRPALWLVYRAFTPPVLFAHGSARDLSPLIPELASEGREFYLSVRPDAAALLRAAGYKFQVEHRMWRMILDPARFTMRPGIAVRLGPADYDALIALYRDGDAAGETPPFFEPAMLRHGIYYGVWEGASIVAAAGTHVLSEPESAAAIGNVYTRRDRRGRGLGAQSSSAVAGALIALGMRTIALNVVETNLAAIRVYQRLGFQAYCSYREGLAGR